MSRLWLPSVFALCIVSAAAIAAAGSGQQAPMSGSAGATVPADPKLLEKVHSLLKQVPLTDGHNDLPWAMRNGAWYDFGKIDIRQSQPKLMTDVARLRAGGLGAQFWSVYVPADLQGQKAVTATLEQVDNVYALVRKYPDVFELARTADDLEHVFKKGRIASMMGMEGGHSIDSSLAALRMFSKLGVGYMTLTHSANIPWADSATDAPKLGGLSKFGEEVVKEMNWLGMLVDLSHVSPDTMEDALRVSQAPVIFSHSSARALCDVPRNVPDAILQKLPANGGVVMVTFVPGFISPEVAAYGKKAQAQLDQLKQQFPNDEKAAADAAAKWREANPEPRATLAQVADHIDHIKKIAGVDHIGVGGDFDGITSVIAGLEDVSKYPALFAELLRRGYSEDDLKKIMGKNIQRVMREAEKVSKKLQAERGPSLVRIEDVDGAPKATK